MLNTMIEGVSARNVYNFCKSQSASFQEIMREFFPERTNQAGYFPSFCTNWFQSMTCCGYSRELKLFIFYVKIAADKSLGERNCRKMQFDYAKYIIKKSDTNPSFREPFVKRFKDNQPSSIPRSIFVFADNAGHFRFSLLEKVDSQENMPKRFCRYTFYIDKRATNRTFKERMDKKWSSFEAIKDAFSVEKLSDDFFNKYREHYADFVAFATGKRMKKQGNLWSEVADEHENCKEKIMSQFEKFGDADKALRDYVKKMMGRLVFLQFLAKKGWLGVPESGKWGDGNKKYLSALFAKFNNKTEQDQFLDAVLEKLFFNTLNTDRRKINDISDNILSLDGSNVRIPYLNGGLFERDAMDETQVDFPAKYFKELFDTFEQYNFTIDENDPDDAEIGIDPEMLGRIFESQLEDNKEKGAFYTPKEIVCYMCQESLIQYLGENPAIRKLVTELDAADIPEKEKNGLISKLKAVKICDPAIGSGAFPMGLLNLLYRVRIALGDIDGNSSEEILKAKKEIIQNNIYGVDIEPGAVDIARLRFWLSIVIDETTPEPLPSFDYKIMQGNSLIEQFYGIDLSKITLEMKSKRKEKELTPDMFAILTDDELTPHAMQELMKYYYDVHDPKTKDGIRKRLDGRIASILKQKVFNSPNEVEKINKIDWKNKPFFLWRTYFMDVFEKGGFDIVIGNPPYVSTKGRSEAEEKRLKDVYGFADDLYYHFILLGYDLLKENGIQTMITSDTYFTTLTKAGLRKELLGNTLLQLVHWGHDIFESAMVSTATFISQKRKSTKSDFVQVFDVKGRKTLKDGTCYRVPQEIFETSINSAIFIPSPLNSQINKLFSERHKRLLKEWWEKIEDSRRITRNSEALSEYRKKLRAGTMTLVGLVTDGGQGLATANNGKYVGVLPHTKAAENIRISRVKKLQDFNRKNHTNYQLPSEELEIWKLFDELKLEYGRDCFGQGYLFRIVPSSLIADVSNLSEEEKKNGIVGDQTFVPYDKGDKDGNRWYLETPYLIDWSRQNVNFLKTHSGHKGQGMPVVRNPKFYFMEGFCYSDIKTFFIRCRQKGVSVHDVKSMSLFPLADKLPFYYIISVINSHFTATVVYNFLNNTPSFQMNDCRMLPIIVPTDEQLKECKMLFDKATSIQKDLFAKRISPEVRDEKLQKVQDSIDELIYGIYGIETQEYLAHTNTVYYVAPKPDELEKNHKNETSTEPEDDARG